MRNDDIDIDEVTWLLHKIV